MTDLDYTGRRVVLTGGATGVGASLLDLLAELGATDVTVIDLKEPTGPHATFIQTDLGDEAAVESAIGRIDGAVDVLINNAGVADTLPKETVFRVNVLAPLRLTEGLLPQIERGGAVVNTASIAGMNWPQRLTEIGELLTVEGWGARFDWFEEHEVEVDTYAFTKEVIQVWSMRMAHSLAEREIRINSVCPSPIDTPLLDDFRKTLSDAAIDFTVKNASGRLVTPREVASALAWLGSPASSFVSGVNLNIDAGFQAALTTGQLDFSSLG